MFSKRYWLLSSCLGFCLVQASSKEFLDFLQAIKQGENEEIELILTINPRIINQAETECGFTPLITAIDCDDINLVARFLSMGADINQTDLYGSSPLAYVESLQMTDFLLAQPDIDLDLVNLFGEDVLAEFQTRPFLQEEIDDIAKLIKAKRLEKLRWEGPAQVTGAVRKVSRKDWIGAVHLFARRDV